MNNRHKWVLRFAASTVLIALVVLAGLNWSTERDIHAHHLAVTQAATSADPSAINNTNKEWHDLPLPVQRYFAFTFRQPPARMAYVEMRMNGEFRRPLKQTFTHTTAEQTAAIQVPALMFSATTQMLGPIWARAYDIYVNGQMQMKAKILSALTVVDEHSTPVLDYISLRRWLLESPLYPTALLPGGVVTWQAIDDTHAKANARYGNQTASMIATFATDGRLLEMQAMEDGDLTTPYHGSGEHVSRDDYQEVSGMMIPMKFTISRAAQGKKYPFWTGQIKQIIFHPK